MTEQQLLDYINQKRAEKYRVTKRKIKGGYIITFRFQGEITEQIKYYEKSNSLHKR